MATLLASFAPLFVLSARPATSVGALLQASMLGVLVSAFRANVKKSL